MLWFLHLAAKARVDVVEYEDDAEGVMPVDQEPTRVTEIALRPRDRGGLRHRRGPGAKAPGHRPRALLHRQQPQLVDQDRAANRAAGSHALSP